MIEGAIPSHLIVFPSLELFLVPLCLPLKTTISSTQKQPLHVAAKNDDAEINDSISVLREAQREAGSIFG